MTEIVSLSEIEAAYARVKGRVHKTPLLYSTSLSAMIGGQLHLKCESLQKTGSFKVRGALNHLAQLSDEQRSRGIVTASAGNHAQAVAWAASAVGVPSTVVMPSSASRAKIAASEGYGATVVFEADGASAFRRARQMAKEKGFHFVHPFDDPWVVAGQGTVGLEILEALPEVGSVVVPVGGGGLLSGVAGAIRRMRPDCRIYGVEPVGAAALRKSLDRGEVTHLDTVRTIADGLAAPMAGELTLAMIQELVTDLVTVNDDEIGFAMEQLMVRAKLVVEPAAAAGLAALLSGRIPVSASEPVVAIVTGGNVDVDRIPNLVRGR